MYQLILPDRTKVWLNSASTITYPTAFNSKQRNVSITGEAYFEVAKDKERPFHVAVNDMNIEVLGTHFNINSYANETDVKTTLLEGSIKLTTGNYNTVLKPGEQAQLGKNGRVNILQSEDMEQVMAWKKGYFNFKNAELPMVMRQLERWYDIDVHYEGEISQRHFQGELPRSMTLQEVLIVLQEVKIKYKINGKMLIIYN
jgi:ferric-dicitrate binding protein FerR (iron transport regulator)